MKNLAREGLAVTLMTVSLAGLSGADAASEGLDAYLSRRFTGKAPGVAVLVVQDGRTVFERGYGLADLRTKRPIDAATNFRLASLTKSFTAAAVVLLVREGRLGYEDTLVDLFPGFPAYGKDMTVRRLLQHTSGLPDYEDLLPAVDPRLPVERTQVKDEEVLELLMREERPKFAPGSRWDYSNSGYVLLGLIVQRVSGVTFPRFLRERIFGPLAMGGSAARVPGSDEVAARAFGHTLEKGKWRLKDQSRTSATLGDGGVYSSLRDMAKWDASFRERALLDDGEIALAHAPVVVPGPGPREPGGAPAAYGFGWFVDPWKGRARAWHYGETAGFRTAIQRFVEDEITVVVLCNRDDVDATELALHAAASFLGR